MTDPAPPQIIENRTFDDLRVGDTARLARTLRAEDIQLFAAMSGDVNPAHVDPEYAGSTQFHGIIAHGMWGAALISTVIGTECPGPGTIYLGQSLRFARPVHVGDTIDVRVTVTAKDAANHHVTLECRCTNQHGADVITGTALVLAPTEKIRRARQAPLQVRLTDRTLRYRQLLALAHGAAPISVAVAHPCSEAALRGAFEAAALGLIEPVLVGPEARIRACAAAAGIDLAHWRIVGATHSHAAAAQAVALARRGEVQALLAGSLHADELMAEVLDLHGGLRTERHVSHVAVLDVPTYPKPLLISDAAINLEPDLDAKRDIVRNAIELAQAIGIAAPRVAILAAVGTVNSRMRSTLDAAALCKMADRGQITGGIVDGPLAFDHAVSPQSARDGGGASPVAGQADILIAPDLEAATLIVKQLQVLADAQVGGVVMGARVPVILSSHADGALALAASCALALLVLKARAAAAVPAVR
jgi:phosphotransacetylase/acyl dehydratase